MITTTTPPLRLLLLEDNDDDADLILRELRREGLVFTIRRVQTESDYRRQLLEFTPSLILADYSLPAFNGNAALAIAREVCPTVPFIFVSGTIGEETAVEALKRGATDYVLKQRPARLGSAVRRALQEGADMQHHRQVDAALRTAQGEYQALAGEWQTTFDAVQSAIWFTDQNRRILRHNSLADKLFKMEAIQRADGSPVAEGPFTRMLQSRRRERAEVAVGKHWFEIAVDPVLNDTGGLVGAVHIATDITERKRLEAEFLRAQRMEAIGSLAGGIAHDLNNILAPVLMVLPTLRDARTLAEQAPGLNLIETSAMRAVGVIRQLLTFSRGLGGERITIHLKHLLNDIASIIRETFPRNLRFTCAKAPDLWPLLADPTQLHQILLNLCINSRDAMPEGGTLAVNAANFLVDDLYASGVPGARPGANVHLQVSDTGTGIPPGHLDKIFDPFFTTKAVGRGTGLGLATVQKVVTAHGGFITVRSQVGQGTTFDIYLPAQPEAAVLPEASAPAPARDGQGELVLLVDDEADIRFITQKTLERHGYRVMTASDGVEAIAVFVTYQEAIKAVITDLLMPGMDGLGLVRVLSKMKPALPVVVSTGLENDPSNPKPNQQLTALRQLGVGAILTKPFAADQLLQALHTVLTPCATPATAVVPPPAHPPSAIGSCQDNLITLSK